MRQNDDRGRDCLDFITLIDCTQIVEGPTHIAGGRLDLVLTDVPDLVKVSTHCSIGTSDHSHLRVVVTLNKRVPQVCCSRRVLLKSRINCGAVRDDLAALPRSAIVKDAAPVEELDRCLVGIVCARVPSKIIRLTNIDKPWFTDYCRRAFDRKNASYRRWNVKRTANN